MYLLQSYKNEKNTFQLKELDPHIFLNMLLLLTVILQSLGTIKLVLILKKVSYYSFIINFTFF
jgi:hypothetical protein